LIWVGRIDHQEELELMTPFIKMTFGTLVVAGALHVPLDHAEAKKLEAAKSTTTNIADCAKVAPEQRDRCISQSRPVKGAAIYAKPKAKPAEIAAAAAASVKQKAERAIAKAKAVVLNKDKPTNIADCAKVAPAQRDRCISLSLPVKGADLAAKSKKTAEVAAAVTATATAAKATAAKAVTAAKSYVTAKDGSTSIADCAKAAPEQRDACISRSRPVKGADLAPAKTTKSAAKELATELAGKAKAATAKAVSQAKALVIRKDGTTDLSDCAKTSPDQRDVCISRSRPVRGPVSLNRT
jgi:hypothetical protein